MNVTIVTTARTDDEARALLKQWGCRSAHEQGSGFRVSSCEEKEFMATTAKRVKGRTSKPKFSIAQAQPLLALRTPARVPAQVRHLPPVLPRAGAAGRDSRRVEVELVDSLRRPLIARDCESNCACR